MLSGHKVVCNCHFTIFIVATPSRHWGLTVFRFFSGPWLVPDWSLRLYYIVALSLSRSRKIVACPALLIISLLSGEWWVMKCEWWWVIKVELSGGSDEGSIMREEWCAMMKDEGCGMKDEKDVGCWRWAVGWWGVGVWGCRIVLKGNVGVGGKEQIKCDMSYICSKHSSFF